MHVYHFVNIGLYMATKDTFQIFNKVGSNFIKTQTSPTSFHALTFYTTMRIFLALPMAVCLSITIPVLVGTFLSFEHFTTAAPFAHKERSGFADLFQLSASSYLKSKGTEKSLKGSVSRFSTSNYPKPTEVPLGLYSSISREIDNSKEC